MNDTNTQKPPAPKKRSIFAQLMMAVAALQDVSGRHISSRENMIAFQRGGYTGPRRKMFKVKARLQGRRKVLA